MDSAIIIFIITINIWDCQGISLREQGRLLQTDWRRLNDPDDYRIPKKTNKFYAGMGSQFQANIPLEKEHKLGARISRTGNSMSVTYGGNLDKSNEEDFYPEYRRAITPLVTGLNTVIKSENPEHILVIALLPAEKRGTSEEDRYRLYLQNDRRSPQLNIRQSRPMNFNFTEQKRAINLLELPIAHYVKDYHKIEMEIQKREAEMKQKQQHRQGAEMFPPTTTDTPIDYLLQNYDRYEDEMMHKEETVQNQNRYQVTQDENQKRYQIMQDEDRYQKKENLMQAYESKQNNLYNNNYYESRLPGSRGQYQQASGQSLDIQFPRPQIQDSPVSRPQGPDTILLSRPQAPDAILVPRPQAPDALLVPRPQAPDPLSMQFQDTEALNQKTPDRQSEDLKFDEEIYNSIPNWESEPAPPNLAALGTKVGEENSDLQAVVDQSSANLADMSVERLVSAYRKLEQEIVRRKEVLEKYKKSLTIAQPAYSDKYKKPEYSQNHEFYQPSSSSPSSTPSPPWMLDQREPPGMPSLRDPPGMPGLPYPPGPSGQPVPPGPPDLPGPPDSPDLLGPSYPTRPTRPTQRPVALKVEETTEYNQAYLSDSELATLFTPQKKRFGEETTEQYQFNADMLSALRNSNKTERKLEKKTKFKVSGPKPPTGIVSYSSRKSFYKPDFDQLYLIYIQRIRHRKRRHRRKPISTYQYAYVNLENLEDVINKFRRLRAGPQVVTLDKKITPTLHDDPATSSDVDDEPVPAEINPKPNAWSLDSGDTFNHIRIDPEAPDMKDFMPKVVFEDHGNKWWFYHQADYNPFKDT